MAVPPILPLLVKFAKPLLIVAALVAGAVFVEIPDMPGRLRPPVAAAVAAPLPDVAPPPEGNLSLAQGAAIAAGAVAGVAVVAVLSGPLAGAVGVAATAVAPAVDAVVLVAGTGLHLVAETGLFVLDLLGLGGGGHAAAAHGAHAAHDVAHAAVHASHATSHAAHGVAAAVPAPTLVESVGLWLQTGPGMASLNAFGAATGSLLGYWLYDRWVSGPAPAAASPNGA